MRFFNFKRLILFLVLISILKLVFGFSYHHQDADQYYFWGKFLAQNGLNHFYEWGIPDSMPPTYPPIIYYVLFATRKFYLFIREFVWFFHLRIPFYFFRGRTSVFIPWYETKLAAINFNKIPAILADFLNSFVIYLILKRFLPEGRKRWAFFISGLFALSLPVIYSSSFWGQVDSLYFSGVLLALFFLLQEKYFLSFIFYLASVFTKPTAVYCFFPFVFVFLKKLKIKDWFIYVLAGLVFTFLLYLPFDQSGNFLWIPAFFQSSLGGELNQMVANAFNFWALLFGFQNIPDTFIWLGASLSFWGYALFFFFFLIIILVSFRKKICPKTIFLQGFLFALAAFLFLPRVHERYFYPAFVFSALLAGFNLKWLIIFLTLSLIHFLNLYHFWWQPKIPFLIAFLSNLFIVRVLIVINIVLFFYSLSSYLKNEETF